MTGAATTRWRSPVAAILAIALSLGRCSSAPPPPPKPPPPPVVTLTLAGAPDQNPDVSGAPSPVAVRIIELTATNRFERADVFALIDHEKQTLDTDDAGSQEIILGPSERRTIKIDPKPGVTAIGVAALYREIDTAKWRAVAPVASEGPTKLTAEIGKLAVTLKPSP